MSGVVSLVMVQPASRSFASCHVRSFLPIARFSRRMINCYVDAVRDGRWRGHSEALYPTLARYNGLQIQYLGGSVTVHPRLDAWEELFQCAGRWRVSAGDVHSPSGGT